jgi:hypothetical protein
MDFGLLQINLRHVPKLDELAHSSKLHSQLVDYPLFMDRVIKFH